jgi:hypothetical protein
LMRNEVVEFTPPLLAGIRAPLTTQAVVPAGGRLGRLVLLRR